MATKRLLRYPKLLIKIAQFSYITGMQYRFQFIVRMIRIIIEAGLGFLLINVFFQNTTALGNWQKNEIFLLYGVFTALYSLVFVFINGNLEDLGWNKIINGELDGILLKPVDSQFLVSFESMHMQNLFRVLSGILIMAFAMFNSALSPSLSTWLIFAATAVSSLVIQYTLLFIVSTLSFWTLTSEPVVMTVNTLTVTRYPMDIFPRKIVQLLTIIPIIFIATIPTKVLLGKIDLLTLACPIVAIILFVMSRKFYHFALLQYSSASS